MATGARLARAHRRMLVREVSSGMHPSAVISARGARRWHDGHPWVFRSDVVSAPESPPGAVPVRDQQGRALGWALWSPASEISLRLLDRDPDAVIAEGWWHARIAHAIARRAPLAPHATAYRLVHGEGDGLPSLVADRYDRWVVVQLLSAGLEAFRDDITEALRALAGARGILARNDAPVRGREGLARVVEPLWGEVPREVAVVEHGVQYLAAPHTGQKTGAFLDQRENRVLAGSVARGRALDLFSYHGSFALHLARGAKAVTAVDSSAPALERASENMALNGVTNVTLVEADAFEFLRRGAKADARYDTIVVDPPALAKNKASLEGALRAYRDLNLHAMRVLETGGLLYTASCSYHVSKALFLEMIQQAAAAAGRRMVLRAVTGQPLDHPEVVTVPETGYLKGALLEAAD
jgi:23S rRNA (cytosine1962-C5)-methyltransferase